jgi:CheY-like chemotaxis protein
MPTVLIIDDNAAVAIALEVLFSLHDIDALRAASPEEGLALLANNEVDLVIQDMNFTADTTSGEEGTALFREIRKRHPDLPVILLTAWTHLDAAVDLVKLGRGRLPVQALERQPPDRHRHQPDRTGPGQPRAGASARSSERRQRANWNRASTCAAWCGRTRPPNASCTWPARWRAPMCRC